MSSDLRKLYDRLYIRIDTFLQGRAEARADRRFSKTVSPPPALDEEYRTIVRPYWSPFRVSVPKKYVFRLFCNADKGLDPHLEPRYIPDDLWYDRILPHYNDLTLARAMQDKCLHNVFFPDIRRPETIVKCISGVFYDDELNLLSRGEAAARVPGHGRILAKVSVGSSQGRDVRFYDSDRLTPAEAEDIFRQFGRDFILQEKLEQHEALARLNPTSLNTVRIITFLHRNEVRVLSACLRVGGPQSELDNTSQGGVAYTIAPDGTLCYRGYTHKGGRWRYSDELPTGEPIGGYAIPGYDKAAQAVCSYAARMSHFKIIGWDIAIAPDGEPVLIEYNVLPGANQETDAPTFGDLTDEVLTEVFGRR